MNAFCDVTEVTPESDKEAETFAVVAYTTFSDNRSLGPPWRVVHCAKVPASFLYFSNARRARSSTRGDMNTPERSFLAEGLKELRAAIGEVRAEIEEVEGSPLASAVRERLNVLLEAEQHLHTKIEVLDCRVTPTATWKLTRKLRSVRNG
jgi:hypothetical protein